jgi:hypothetical protein
VDAGPALRDGGVDRCGVVGAVRIAAQPRLLLVRPGVPSRYRCGHCDVAAAFAAPARHTSSVVRPETFLAAVSWVRVWLHSYCLVVKFDLIGSADQRRTLEIFVQATDKLFHK